MYVYVLVKLDWGGQCKNHQQSWLEGGANTDIFSPKLKSSMGIVCVWEKERETERERGREGGRKTKRKRERDREEEEKIEIGVRPLHLVPLYLPWIRLPLIHRVFVCRSPGNHAWACGCSCQCYAGGKLEEVPGRFVGHQGNHGDDITTHGIHNALFPKSTKSCSPSSSPTPLILFHRFGTCLWMWMRSRRCLSG